MSFTVGPVAVPAAGTVQIGIPNKSPEDLAYVVLDNATPYILTITLGVDARFLAPFTSDLFLLPAGISQELTLGAAQAPGGPVSTAQSYITATYYAQDETPPGGYPVALAAQLIQALVTGGHLDSVGTVTGDVGGNILGSVAAVGGNVGGNVAGSVASVVGNVGGSVASVVGNLGGNVVGSVASVVGNLGGNVTGSVGSVVGAVGSVTGNVGGNVAGSVASVSGNVSGNVVGTVSSVTGNVAGSVASVSGNVSGNVAGSVASVVGNVAGNVIGSVTNVTIDAPYLGRNTFYWPCISGESFAPTRSTAVTYGTFNAKPALKYATAATSSSIVQAVWGPIGRVPYDTAKTTLTLSWKYLQAFTSVAGIPSDAVEFAYGSSSTAPGAGGGNANVLPWNGAGYNTPATVGRWVGLYFNHSGSWKGQDTNVNLLTAQDSDLEGAGIGSWVAALNCALSNSTTVAMPGGTHSLAITATAAGDTFVQSGDIAVNPSTQYSFSYYIRGLTVGATCKAYINFYDGSHAFTGTQLVGSAVFDTTTGFTRVTVSGASPANAAFAKAFVYFSASGATEVHYVDHLQVEQSATVTPWVNANNQAPTNSWHLLVSDGTHWQDIPTTDAVGLPGDGKLHEWKLVLDPGGTKVSLYYDGTLEAQTAGVGWAPSISDDAFCYLMWATTPIDNQASGSFSRLSDMQAAYS